MVGLGVTSGDEVISLWDCPTQSSHLARKEMPGSMSVAASSGKII